MKKNTLLYLDSNLVREAKKQGINLSEIAENAIKTKLFPYLSIGERIAIDFKGYLRDLEKEGSCFFIPFEIESVEIENIGPIRILKEGFGKKNIIVGSNATGKTILIRAIAHALGNSNFDENEIIAKNKNNGKIKIRLKKSDFIEVKLDRKKENTNYKCILIDDAIQRLNEKYHHELLSYLKRLDAQVILTSLRQPKGDLSKFKVISIENQGGD